MVGNMRNIPPVPCMGTPTHYGIYTYMHLTLWVNAAVVYFRDF